jgi:uncharacterized coiled-coil protein SlyX
MPPIAQNEIAELQAQLQLQDQRIIELEVEAAFRRRSIEDLDEVVREQGVRIAQLEQRLTEIIGQMGAATHEGEVD